MIDRRTLGRDASRLVIAGVLIGFALAGCKPSGQEAAPSAAPPLAALPLSTSEATPIAPAPPASALPPAPRARIGRLADAGERYAFADRADGMNSGFGDAPPDYAFDYGDGERPWVWRADDGSLRIAEPLPDGGYRYYYYDPGADMPYLVRDPDYSYGYDDGVLVVVYDRRGQVLTPDDLNLRADLAGRFLARARAIYEASQRRQREAVAQAHWAARRNAIAAELAQWAAMQMAEQDWRAYHAAHQQQDEAHWAGERYRRETEAARFAQATNDRQQAERDLQAARQAQARTASAGQLQTPQASSPGGLSGFGPKPPPPPLSPPSSTPAQVSHGGVRAPDLGHQPFLQTPGGVASSPSHPSGPPPGASQGGASQTDAARAAAARQAQIAAERQAQLQAEAQARAQAQNAKLAADLARRNAQLAAAAARKAASAAPIHHDATKPPAVKPPSPTGDKHPPKPRRVGPDGDHPPGAPPAQ